MINIIQIINHSMGVYRCNATRDIAFPNKNKITISNLAWIQCLGVA